MALRLIEIFLPQSESAYFRELIKDESVIGFWQEESSDTGFFIKVLLTAEKNESFLDDLEKKFTAVEGFRVVMLPVEATLPRYEEKEKEKKEEDESPYLARGLEKKSEKTSFRISREELFTEVSDSIKLSNVYIAMVILSSVVASVGLIRDNVAMIIGAMVIAPLLGPNVGLAFATTLGDYKLAREALRTNLQGMVIALGFSIGIGYVLEVDPTTAEIASRTEIHLSDIALALATGSAGVISLTSGKSGLL